MDSVAQEDELKIICFVSPQIGRDVPFYDKMCVEDGNFAWSDYKLNHTVFINPIELYEENVIERNLFKFVGGEPEGL